MAASPPPSATRARNASPRARALATELRVSFMEAGFLKTDLTDENHARLELDIAEAIEQYGSDCQRQERDHFALLLGRQRLQEMEEKNR